MEYNTIDDVIDDIFIGNDPYEDITESIYHYTSPTGLLGILHDKSINLQFTRYDCVNDTSEGESVIRCYKKACEQLLNNREIDRDYYNKIIEVRLGRKIVFKIKQEGTPTIFASTYEAYICCFSLNKDSLPMWNYYSKGNQYQGYSIGFDQLLLIYNQDLWNRTGAKFSFNKVIYDDEQKIEFIKDWIKKLYSFKNNDKELNRTKSALEKLIFNWQLFFKSECFSHERELRAVIYKPDYVQSGLIDCKQLKIEYRTKGAYIIPYVTIELAHKEYLKEIFIGPLTEKEISKSAIESLLKERGYGATITNSKVPIRF